MFRMLPTNNSFTNHIYIYVCVCGHMWGSIGVHNLNGRAKAGRPARTCIQQICEATGCNSEDLPEAMNDWEKWRERVRDIRAGGTT